MTFLRSLFCVLAVTACALAADQTAVVASQFSSASPLPATPWFSGMKHVNPALTFASPSHKFKAARHTPISSFAVLRGDVCLTMRSYKVKRTERLSGNQSGVRGYSTCEMARNYDIRTSEGRPALVIPAQ